jgi:hypothetical protein
MQVEEMCACDIESSFTLHWIPKYSIKYSVSLINDTEVLLKIRK